MRLSDGARSDGSDGVGYRVVSQDGRVLSDMTLRGNSASIKSQIEALSSLSTDDLGLHDYTDTTTNQTITAAQTIY